MPQNTVKSPKDNYDFSMKHRLVGAAILISFAVLILPWVLGSSSEDELTQIESGDGKVDVVQVDKGTSNTVEQKVNIVQADDNVEVFVSRVQPVETQPSAVQEVAEKVQIKEEAKPKEEVTKKVTEKQTKKEVVKPKVVAKPKAVPKVEKKKVSKITRGYIVSVGVFGDNKNATNLVSTLKDKGFSPATRKENFKGKKVTRIYMGPFATRSEAGKMKLRLFEKQKIPSLVKEFP